MCSAARRSPRPADSTPLGEDGDSEFGDLIEDPETIQPGEAVSFTLLQEQLHSVLGTLSERKADVVTMRFGLTDGQPKTLGEIGKVCGVTREPIQQIESTTMSKLRHPSRSKVLRDYLDRPDRRLSAPGCNQRSSSARLADAQNAQIWTASVVIGIESKSAPIGGYRACALMAACCPGRIDPRRAGRQDRLKGNRGSRRHE